MKAQITIEFLITVAIYLTFIFVIISSMKNFEEKVLEETKAIEDYLNSFRISTIISIKNLNNYKTNYRIREKCSIAREYVICGNSTRKIFISDEYEEEIV